MKRIFLVSIAGITVSLADFNPKSWYSAPLETAAGNQNEWYFYPDPTKAPRILVKATTANNTPARKFLTGGPPAWAAGASASLGQINKQGIFVPKPDGGGYLIAPHNTASLKVAIFDSHGNSILEVVDSNSGTYSGISAELDTGGTLHVGYVWNGGTLCYARRASGPASPWQFTSLNLPSTTVHETAMVPHTLPSPGVYLYYTASAMGVRSLWQNRPGVVGSQLLIQWGANPRIEVERYVATSLRGSRGGDTGRLFFFGSENTSTWKLKRHQGSGSPLSVENAGVVTPKSIHVATGPDGNQRIAWYNPNLRRIHYLKPISGGADIPTLAGYPVETTGPQTDADLLGLHFDANGLPYLLYRTARDTAFVAFPNDNFDTNGNGRPDIIDTALGSEQPGLEMLPLQPAVHGVPGSSNRFKFRFPAAGSAISNGQGAVISVPRNLSIGVETSTDGLLWTTATGSASVSYFQTSASGTPPEDIRTFVGVFPGEAPGTVPRRFARLRVSRQAYPY